MQTTTNNTLIKNIDSTWIKKFSKDRKEPTWALDLRLKAFENYNSLPWPDKKSERWRRTELKALKWDTLEFSPTHSEKLDTAKNLAKTLATISDVAKTNGKTPAEVYWDYNKGYRLDLPAHLKSQGLKWLSFEDALVENNNQVKEAWLEAIEKSKENKFASLNLALGNGGLCLFIPKNKQVAAPLQQYLSGGGPSRAHFPLTFIFVEEGSEAQVWEELVSKKDADPDETHPGFVSSYTHIHIKDNTKASFFYLQHWGTKTVHFQFQDITQQAHSRLETVALSVGGRISHGESTIHLNGKGAENKVLGVLYGDQKQNFENWITQNHNSPETNSDIQYRGVLQGKAKSFFSGMVSIIKEAQKSDAYQSSKSLLLSKEARADAIPNLEILADDVKCAHGAAVGPVDEDQKYYLQTRGVTPEVAEKIIIQGFFEPVISALPSEEIQEHLRSFIEEKLENR